VLTQKKILLVWLPLAAMWVIMGIEQPAITSVVARLGDAKTNLAAFGIAFSFVLIMESPILQLLTAATALSTDRRSYRRLLLFTTLLGGGMTVIHVVFGVTPAFRLLLTGLFRIPEDIVEPARIAYLYMAPGALLVAYRRLWQGVLIRHRHTTTVAVAMSARILAVALTLAGGLLWPRLPGSTLGAIAMSIGVFFSAASVYLPARRVIRFEMTPAAGDDPDAQELTWRRLLSFYIPLALTSFIGLAARPLLTMGIALGPEAIESLAVWPVLLGYLFLFTSVDISFQEVVVTLLRGDNGFAGLRKFSTRLAVISTSVFLFTVVLPLSRLWFKGVAGLSPELIGYTRAPMMILSVIPGLAALVSWYRGVLISQRRTSIITRAVGLNLVFLVGPVFLGALLLPVSSVVVAAGAYVTALSAEMLYLRGKIFPGKQRWAKFTHQNANLGDDSKKKRS
jgi:progressive ankylosis protein